MKTLLVVWCSRTGGSRQMAFAAVRGARACAGVRVILRRARYATAREVLGAGALIFAAPENLAALAGEMKEFFDRVYYAVLDQTNGKPYAALICAGSDGRNAQRQIERIANGLRLRRVADAQIARTGAQTPAAILASKQLSPEVLMQCMDTAAALAAGLEAGIF